MIIKGTALENFNAVPKIQDELKRIGIILLNLNIEKNVEFLLKEIERCLCNQFILIEVMPEFTKKKLFARGFRNDHFVLIKSHENNLTVYNDIPEKAVNVTFEELIQIYAGRYFKLNILRELSFSDSELLWNSRIFLPRDNKILFGSDDFKRIDNIAVKLRNMLFILKIARYRMKGYYGKHINTEFFDDYLLFLEKQYALLEYYNLKKNQEKEVYLRIFLTVQEYDNNLIRRVCENLK